MKFKTFTGCFFLRLLRPLLRSPPILRPPPPPRPSLSLSLSLSVSFRFTVLPRGEKGRFGTRTERNPVPTPSFLLFFSRSAVAAASLAGD